MRSLGIPGPDAASMAARRNEGLAFAEQSVDKAVREGKLVIFTAAQRDQRTIEKPLMDPLDESGSRRTFGYFTYQLFAEVMAGRGIRKYRDLIRRVKIRFDSAGVAATTPLAVGQLDGEIPFFHGEDKDPFVVRDRDGIRLSLGAMDGVERGSIVEVESVGAGPVRLAVDRVRMFDSICRLHGEHAALSPQKVLGFNNAMPAGLITEGLDGRRVAVWVHEKVKAACRELDEPVSFEESRLVKEVDQPEAAEWILDWAGDGVLLSSSSNPLDRYWSRPAKLESLLEPIYFARNLRRFATHPWIGGLPSGLKVELACQRVGALNPVPLAAGERVHPGDRIQVNIRNETDDPWAVFLFAMGPDQSVSGQVGPEEAIEPGASVIDSRELSFAVTDSSPGLNSFLVLASRRASEEFRALPFAGLERFSGEYEQPDIPKRDGVDRSSSTAFGQLMNEIAPSTTRSSASYEDVEAWVGLIPLELAWGPLSTKSHSKAQVSADALWAMDEFSSQSWPVELPEFSFAGWSGGGARDLVELGCEDGVGWLIDPRASLSKNGAEAAKKDGSEAAEQGPPPPFRPAFALVSASEGWVSAYDCDGDGAFDVAILDEDGDLRGDRRWERDRKGGEWGAARVGALDPLVCLTDWLRAGEGPGVFSDAAVKAALGRLSGSVFASADQASADAENASEQDVDSNALLSFPAPSAGPLRASRSPLVARVEAQFSELCESAQWLEKAPGRASRLTVEVWDNPTLNAICVGRTIRISKALVEALDSRMDLVGAVLAHEIAHGLLEHGTERRQLEGAMADSLDVRHHLIRQAEFEADAVAVKILERAGRSPEALYELLIRLHRIQRAASVGWIQGVGGDHGSLMERLARLRPTNARAQALRAFERGTAFLECRRPDRACAAFELALEGEQDVPGGLDEVRFALARARIQLYHEMLPREVRDEWLLPDFGPQLTVDDALAHRGGEVVPADLERWDQAKRGIDTLASSVDPEMVELLMGTVLVLHPTGAKGQHAEGVEVLERLLDSDAELIERRPELYYAAVNNLALGLDRVGRREGAFELLVGESELALSADAVFFANAARLVSEARDEPTIRLASGLLRTVFSRAHVDSRAYAAAAEGLERLSELDQVELVATPEPGYGQLCVPIAIGLGSETLEVYGTRRALENAIGPADDEERVHPRYGAFLALSWLGPGQGEGRRTDMVALVEDGVLVKLTTYREGSSVTLRAREGAVQEDRVLAIGQPQSRLVELFGEDAIAEIPTLNARLLGRSNEVDGIGLGRSHRWIYFPTLSFGVLVEDGEIRGLTLSPIYQNAKSRRRR